MRYHQLIETLSFQTEQRGAHHDQSDWSLYALDDGEYAGRIDYVTYFGDVHVQMIDVPEGKRRRGYGTAMVHELQSMYPDTEINMGGLTDDGSKLLGAIPQVVKHNPEYQAKARRLGKAKALLVRFQAVVDAFDANPTEQARQKVVALHNRWNALHSAEWKLEQQLHDMQPSKRL